MSAYIAYSERPTIICSYDKKPNKAIKKAMKIVDKLCSENEHTSLLSLSVHMDDECYYQVTAIISAVDL